jgi:predicted dehydrogenase
MSSLEAMEIMEAMHKVNGFLAVTFNYSGYPMLRELRRMIRGGQLGPIQQVHIEMPQEGFARLNREQTPMIPQKWRLSDGVIPTIHLDLGVHVDHLMHFLTEERPLEVIASQKNFGSFHHVIDNVMGLVRYTNDIEGTFWFSKAALGNSNGLRVRVFGENASAEWIQVNPEALFFNDNCGRRTQIDRANIDIHLAHLDRYNRFKSGHPAGFLEAFANIYGDIALELAAKLNSSSIFSDHIFSVEQALEGLILLEAINRSSIERRWVSLV